ncbi:FxSxx-COOH system tetratricopeptide repeat protein [Catellatospora paridis]|uniref:FxSxx-COOH system tetratricopeptide repeat protein n=1 Tax=Catellatospora paridis TaxID=1617086 RepID=UPI0012D37FE0|nr:FxSxx-COOH system tetratricopeptide repeat protein [Catellatospora paridis]
MPLLLALWSAPVATLAAVAVNAATDVESGWPGPLGWVQAHPWRWTAGLTAVAALTTFLTYLWQLRMEHTNNANEPAGADGGAPALVVSGGTAGVAGLVSGGTVTVNQQNVAQQHVVQHIHPSPPTQFAPGLLGMTVNLPGRNPDFSGREDLRCEVERILGAGPVAVVAVQGMGGIGKTQLALELAHRGWAVGRYEVAWWVRAESALTIAEDLAALAPGLGVPVVADQERVVTGVRAALTKRNDWLLVFDNAPDAAGVRDWLPAGPGHVLITSRSLDWSGLAVSLRVDLFTPEESSTYLRQRTGETGPTVAELAQALGHLPLALAQAAAYMERHGRLSVQRYLALYRDRRGAGDLLAEGLGGYPASVATTWLIHFEWLEQHAPAALQLLRLCSFLDPDDINLALLLSQPEVLAGDLAGDLKRACGSQFDWEQAAGALLGTALATRVGDDRVRVHRLVGEVTRHQLAEHGSDLPERWAGLAVDLLVQLTPERPWEPSAWPVMVDLASHVAAATDLAPAAANTATVLGRLGQYLEIRAEYAAARAHQQRALAIEEAVHGADHPEVARTLGNLGNVEQNLGNLAAARAHQQRALTIEEAAYGPDHPDIAQTLTNLGIVEEQLGDLAAARAHQQRALTIEEAAYGPDHPDIAQTLTNLGIVERQLGDLAAARAHQQRALTIKEAAYGPDHPQVAITLSNLGIVEYQLGDLTAARAHLQRALAIFEAFHGPDHPHVAGTLTNLGVVERQLASEQD